jgi:uncharacterized RDD family membrane protein YckC
MFLTGSWHQTGGTGPQFAANGGSNLIQLIYSVVCIGRFGATLGMMACGIRVVRPNGDAVSYLRALGRYFANLVCVFVGAMAGGLIGGLLVAVLSGNGRALAVGMAILFAAGGALINYLAIVWDKEKRALHDRICDTRVVYK